MTDTARTKSIPAKSALAGTAALALMAGMAGSASAADYTLKFSHFWPAVSSQHTQIFEPWGKAIEEQSKGRIKVEIYPSQTLTKAQAAYDGVKNRISDVAATAQGYTANRFPLTQVVELPGLFKDAGQGSCAIQALYDEKLIDGEYKDSHVLFLFTHGPGHIHTTNKAVEKPSDLAGMRIRRPTTVVGEMLEGLGAQAVGMPAPQVYESLQRGVIDGVAMPWEGSLVFRLHEQAKYHTEINLYTLAFVMTMNKQVYDGMPADLKKIIDDNSGTKWAKRAAKVFEDLDAKGEKAAADHKIFKIKGGVENPEWAPILTATTANYIKGLEDKGVPAGKVYARAKELAATSCK